VGQSKSNFCLTEKSKVSVLIDSHKSFPIQDDEHFLTVCRYVEHNAPNWFPERKSGVGVRFWHSTEHLVPKPALLSSWPIPRPRSGIERVNPLLTEKELAAVRHSVKRGCSFGDF
jgi:putative transposase